MAYYGTEEQKQKEPVVEFGPSDHTWRAWFQQYDQDVLGYATNSFVSDSTWNLEETRRRIKLRNLIFDDMPNNLSPVQTAFNCTESMNVVMIGPPGSGKGTHGPFIKDQLCICHLATGDMLREAIKAGSDLGKVADQIMKKGELVPDELVLDLISDKFDSADCSRGVLFDGFPRTLR